MDIKKYYDGITITEYQLYETHEGGFGLGVPPKISYPYVRFYIEKETYDKLKGETRNLRPKLDVILEKITKTFASEHGKTIKLIGFSFGREICFGEDNEDKGYHATVTFSIEQRLSLI